MAALDMGGTRLAAALAQGGQLAHRCQAATLPDRRPEAMLEAVLDLLEPLLPQAKALAVAATGTVYEGRVTAPNQQTLPWVDVDLQGLLSRHAGLPVFVLNDADAWGEARYGAGRGVQNDALGETLARLELPRRPARAYLNQLERSDWARMTAQLWEEWRFDGPGITLKAEHRRSLEAARSFFQQALERIRRRYPASGQLLLSGHALIERTYWLWGGSCRLEIETAGDPFDQERLPDPELRALRGYQSETGALR